MQAVSTPRPPSIAGHHTLVLRAVTIALVLLVLVITPLGITTATAQQEQDADAPADTAEAPVLEYYGTDTCPFCREMQPFLDALEDEYPGLVVARYDVSNAANAERWEQEMTARGERAQGVPTAILGDEVWVGFNDQIATDIETTVADTPGVDTPREDVAAAPTGAEDGGPSVMAMAIGAAVVLLVAVALFAPRRSSH